MFKDPLFYSVMAPKCRSSDAGDSDCQREAISASFKWNGESSQFAERKKESYSEVAKIYGKNEFSIHEIAKKGKEIIAKYIHCSIHPQFQAPTGGLGTYF